MEFSRAKLNIGDIRMLDKLKKEFGKKFISKEDQDDFINQAALPLSIWQWITENFVPAETYVIPSPANEDKALDGGSKFNAIDLFNNKAKNENMEYFTGYQQALTDLKKLGVIDIEPLPSRREV